MGAPPHVPEATVGVAWHELRYPRPATDTPSESFRRSLAAAAPLIVAGELDALNARLDEDVTAVGELTPDPDQPDRKFYEGFYAGAAHGLRIAKLALERRASELRGEV